MKDIANVEVGANRGNQRLGFAYAWSYMARLNEGEAKDQE